MLPNQRYLKVSSIGSVKLAKISRQALIVCDTMIDMTCPLILGICKRIGIYITIHRNRAAAALEEKGIINFPAFHLLCVQLLAPYEILEAMEKAANACSK
jgi:hypothetical protein